MTAPSDSTISLSIDRYSDQDGIDDANDNCVDLPNPTQLDTDGDGFGNRCDADLNNDCIVNAGDLGALKTVFFSNDPDADLNGDGVVNAGDLGLMEFLFFAPPGQASVPNDCVRCQD